MAARNEVYCGFCNISINTKSWAKHERSTKHLSKVPLQNLQNPSKIENQYFQQTEPIMTRDQFNQFQEQVNWYNNNQTLLNLDSDERRERLKERDRRKIKEAKSNATELLKNLNKYDLKLSTTSKESYDVYSTTDGRNVYDYFMDIAYTSEILTNEFRKKIKSNEICNIDLC